MLQKITNIKNNFVLFFVLALASGNAHYVFAAEENPGRRLLMSFVDKVVNPLITILFAVALAFFLLGVIKLVAGGESDDARTKGRDHILWGLVGMSLMFAAFAMVKLVTSTFGIDQTPINDFMR